MSASKKQPVPVGSFPFTYDEFAEWYDSLSKSRLQPARDTFTRVLNEILDQELSDVDRLRIRVSHSRIKDATRLWNKMLNERYVHDISKLEDILSVIDDLVGVRVTCNNLVDVRTFKNIIVALEYVDVDEMPAGLCIDPKSEKNHAKDSGYRAYHINLHTLIQARNGWSPARGELQVRTLLQDSWGELTHEDTYKPGSHMPQLVTKFAKRMADLLATVDDLAQDLRNELDELAQRDATGEPDERVASDSHDDVKPTAVEDVREALVAEARKVVGALTKPASLAQVAWQVQANFGREVTANWGGFGTFKELIRAAVPDVSIVDIPPGRVLPANFPSTLVASEREAAASSGTPPEGVPLVVNTLRQHDSGVPLLSSEKMSKTLDFVVDALSPAVWVELGLEDGILGISQINQLAKRVRDEVSGQDFVPSRSNLDYIFKSLYFSQNLRPGLDKSAIGRILADWFFARALKYGLVQDPVSERDELNDWLEEATR